VYRCVHCGQCCAQARRQGCSQCGEAGCSSRGASSAPRPAPDGASPRPRRQARARCTWPCHTHVSPGALSLPDSRELACTAAACSACPICGVAGAGHTNAARSLHPPRRGRARWRSSAGERTPRQRAGSAAPERRQSAACQGPGFLPMSAPPCAARIPTLGALLLHLIDRLSPYMLWGGAGHATTRVEHWAAAGCLPSAQLPRLSKIKGEQSLVESPVRCAVRTSLLGSMLSVRESAGTWELPRMPAAAPCDVHCEAARG